MALTISAQHGFIAYQDGTVILPSMGVIVKGSNGFVQYVKQDGTVTGTDFKSNPAIIFPYCMSSVTGLPAVPTQSSVKWYYGSTEILFETKDTPTTVDIEGTTYTYKPCTNFKNNGNAIFGLTTHNINENNTDYEVTALVIVGNVASATVFSDVTFKMEGKTSDNHYFSCSKVLPIQLTEGNTIKAYIVDNGDSVISQGETTVTLQGGVQENGSKIEVKNLTSVKWEYFTSDGWKTVESTDGMFKLSAEDSSSQLYTKITIYEKAINASLLLRFSAVYNNRAYIVTHEVLDMNDGYTFYDGCNFPGNESSVGYGEVVTIKPVVKKKNGDTDSHTWSCDVLVSDADGNLLKNNAGSDWKQTITPCDGTESKQEFAYADLFASGRTYVSFIYNVYAS